MSKLAEFLKSTWTPANPAISANPDEQAPKISNISEISSGISAFSESPASHEPVAPLSSEQEAARRQVLADLEANPSVMRTMCNRFEDDKLIVTLAIRDIGTCELLIPAERFDRSKLSNYAALFMCLTGRV